MTSKKSDCFVFRNTKLAQRSKVKDRPGQDEREVFDRTGRKRQYGREAGRDNKRRRCETELDKTGQSQTIPEHKVLAIFELLVGCNKKDHD